MSPGEELIHKYIIDKSSLYACMRMQIVVTKKVLNTYYYNEINRMKGIQGEVWNCIEKEFGKFTLVDKFSSSGNLFSGLLNDIGNMIEFQLCSQGTWKIDPINGIGIHIPYSEFESNLGVSKDVAKDCILRLIDKDKISRKKGMGGFIYLVNHNDLFKQMKESPGKWKPMRFNSQSMDYEEDLSLWPVIEEAQKEIEPIQEYYERVMLEEIMKNNITINE